MGPPKNWPYTRKDHISDDHITGTQCIRHIFYSHRFPISEQAERKCNCCAAGKGREPEQNVYREKTMRRHWRGGYRVLALRIWAWAKMWALGCMTPSHSHATKSINSSWILYKWYSLIGLFPRQGPRHQARPSNNGIPREEQPLSFPGNGRGALPQVEVTLGSSTEEVQIIHELVLNKLFSRMFDG